MPAQKSRSVHSRAQDDGEFAEQAPPETELQEIPVQPAQEPDTDVHSASTSLPVDPLDPAAASSPVSGGPTSLRVRAAQQALNCAASGSGQHDGPSREAGSRRRTPVLRSLSGHLRSIALDELTDSFDMWLPSGALTLMQDPGGYVSVGEGGYATVRFWLADCADCKRLNLR